MLDINWIRANAAAVDAALAHRKNVPFSASELIAMDDARKTVITRLEDAQAARTSAKADAKANRKVTEARADAKDDKRDALYKAALERCDAQTGDAKNRCMREAKTRYGQ